MQFSVNSQLTSIGDDAFWGSSLTGMLIPVNVTSLGINIFAGCSLSPYGLRFAKNSKLTTLTSEAFTHAMFLEIVLPDGLETIEANAFFATENLSTITIPVSVKNIND